MSGLLDLPSVPTDARAARRSDYLHPPSPAADRSGTMGKRRRLGKPKSLWMRSPLPLPKGKWRLPSTSKYDMFSTTAAHGTCKKQHHTRSTLLHHYNPQHQKLWRSNTHSSWLHLQIHCRPHTLRSNSSPRQPCTRLQAMRATLPPSAAPIHAFKGHAPKRMDA